MKTSRKCAFFALLLLLICSAAVAQSASCPDLPNKVNVTVTPSVSFDPASGLYTYAYVLTNAASSPQEVASFAIDFAGKTQDLTAPHYWSKGPFSSRNTILWDASVAAPFPNGQDTGGIPPGLADIKPGTSLAGFSFKSSKGPGTVNFYIHGYVDLATGHKNAAGDDPEAVAYTCPSGGSDFFDIAFHGTTTGPVDFVSVNISIKPIADAPVPINVGDKGATPVAILSTDTFDATTIDASTLRFGPSGAVVQGKAKNDDVNRDGRIDMVAQFPSQNIGVSCADTALVLKGNTKTGTPIQGSQAIRTLGCN